MRHQMQTFLRPTINQWIMSIKFPSQFPERITDIIHIFVHILLANHQHIGQSNHMRRDNPNGATLQNHPQSIRQVCLYPIRVRRRGSAHGSSHLAANRNGASAVFNDGVDAPLNLRILLPTPPERESKPASPHSFLQL